MQIAARGRRQPGRADRAARRAPGTVCRRCGRGWPRACATSSTGASARCRSSPTTTCSTRLRDELRGRRRRGVGGAAARALPVVLVDEFQDTDPIQWEILQRAFGDGGVDAGADRRPETGDLRLPRRRRLLVPGRPPQAAGERATLEVNCRSDQGLIDAYDAMFGGAKLGHAGIVYRHVRAAPGTGRRGCRARRRLAAARAGGGSRRDPAIETTPPGLRRPELGARVHRARPGGGPRAACSRRAPRSRRAAAARRHVAVLVRHNRHAVRRPRRAGRRRRARGHQRRGQRLRARPPRASGCGCWRR